MFDIGASLAAARQAQGLSLADVEARSAIRVEQLEALEAGRFDAFPGRAYCRAFIRTYARTLELDADRFIASFEEQVPPDEDPLPLIVHHRRAPSARVVGAILLLAGVLAGALLLGTSGKTPRPPPLRAAIHGRTRLADAGPFRPPDAVAAPLSHALHPALVIRAVRGPCWVEARLGGANGPILFEGMIEPGGVKRFSAHPVWIRFGAPGNVTATRGSHALAGLTGPTPLDLTA